MRIRQAILIILIGVCGSYSPAMTPVEVRVHFIKSPIADYLMYLLYGNTGRYGSLVHDVPLHQMQSIDGNITLPEVAASSHINTYSDLYRLIVPYRTAKSRIYRMPGARGRFRILSYDSNMPTFRNLRSRLYDGAGAYPFFLVYWTKRIAPDEERQIKAWKAQEQAMHPFLGLQRIAKLKFPCSHVDVVALALHGSGSGNTDPEGIYTTLFTKPNLPWVVGHEGTHLLVDEYEGHNWHRRPGAKELIRIAENDGATADDLEEALCLFMQVKLSQYYGQTSQDYVMSTKVTPSVKKEVLVSLEDGWSGYISGDSGDLITWFISQARKALKKQ